MKPSHVVAALLSASFATAWPRPVNDEFRKAVATAELPLPTLVRRAEPEPSKLLHLR